MEQRVKIFIGILWTFMLVGKSKHESILLQNVTEVLKTAKSLDDINGSFVDKIKSVGAMAETFTEMIAPALKNLKEETSTHPLSTDSSLLKRLLIEVDRQFKSLSMDFKGMMQRLEEQRIQIQLGITEQKIRVAAQELELLHSIPAEAFSEQVQLFILNYESDFQNSAKKLLYSIMNENNLFHRSIFNIAIPLTSYNAELMQLFMMNMLKLLLQGVNVEMSYLIVKNYSESYKFMKRDWGKKIREVTQHMTKVDQIVRSKWREQAEIDVIQMADTKDDLDHYSFAHLIYNHLQNKYPWRHWFTVVYDPIDGSNKHWMSTCGGFTKFRFHGRNIVVASVDENKPYLEEKEGLDILMNLPASATAEGFYYSLPDSITGNCEWYASSGCLKYGYKGHHVGFGKRTVIVGRNDSNMTLHLFG
ncbi:uncharacterized protein LOC133175799 [Saccostrea echinata]|uniref:uncharacterized protein LOC133175799 n=1 Tax=Saccostrea echinata TaxID=191078 RepID=UPI002A8349A9|nr:uncharacterized protein LOC133175799 [Saccostrea echinata]